MKEIAAVFGTMSQEMISAIEAAGIAEQTYTLSLASGDVVLESADYEITSEDMPGWLVSTEGKLTVALDVTITDELKKEGTARELINRIQNLRKECDFEVTDKIDVKIEAKEDVAESLQTFKEYVCNQTLALSIELVEGLKDGKDVEWNDGVINIDLKKIK